MADRSTRRPQPRREARAGSGFGLLALLCGLGAASCDAAPKPGGPRAEGARDRAAAVDDREIRDADDLRERVARADAHVRQLADSIDDLLHPVPLVTLAQERRFARYRNADHLRWAAELGVDPAAPDSAALVGLPSSTPYWIVRELDHSEPRVTPATLALLEEIGRRFHTRLDEMGLPPYRFEITSALRTAASQADLRGANPNAAPGPSAHEFGTTIDITYAAFAAPEVADAPEVPEGEDAADGPAWLRDHLARDEAALLETVAARRSRELEAILGEELLALQAEGAALVMLERRQPVFHITVARAPAGGG